MTDGMHHCEAVRGKLVTVFWSALQCLMLLIALNKEHVKLMV